MYLISFLPARKYDAFLASDSLIKQIPRLLGPGLSRAGRFPTLVTHNDNLKQKIDEVKATIRFQMKKVSCGWNCYADHFMMLGLELYRHFTCSKSRMTFIFPKKKLFIYYYFFVCPLLPSRFPLHFYVCVCLGFMSGCCYWECVHVRG